MILLNYNNKITIESNKKKNFIRTDTNDIFWLRSKRTIQDWYKAQKPSQFRLTQREQFLTLKDAFNYENYEYQIQMFVGIKPETQPTEPTDLSVMRVPNQELWIISTHQHTWFTQTPLNQFELTTEQAFGGVESKETQEHIWQQREMARRRAS